MCVCVLVGDLNVSGTRVSALFFFFVVTFLGSSVMGCNFNFSPKKKLEPSCYVPVSLAAGIRTSESAASQVHFPQRN